MLALAGQVKREQKVWGTGMRVPTYVPLIARSFSARKVPVIIASDTAHDRVGIS